jgi:Amt family ammonium transporter
VASVIIGSIAGVLVIEAVMMFDKLHVDDPVGATSVHLVNGVFGTLAVGLFGVKGLSAFPVNGLFYGGGFGQLWIQFKGVLAVAAFTLPVSLLVWYAIKKTIGARVKMEDEIGGLDAAEIGMEAYPTGKEIEATSRETYALQVKAPKPT